MFVWNAKLVSTFVCNPKFICFYEAIRRTIACLQSA